MSINQKAEDTVQHPDRPPIIIDGLTEFLKNEHFKRLGVIGNNADTLFKFWKDSVSLFYKEKKAKKRQQTMQSNFGLEAMSFTGSP